MTPHRRTPPLGHLLAVAVIVFLDFRAAAYALAQEETGHISAPYQIEGTAVLTDSRYGLRDDPATAPPLYLVYLGDAENDPQPLLEDHRWITLIGDAGLATASLVDIEKRCRFFCGDEGEACHYAGLYRLDGSTGNIGRPLAAFPGQKEIADLDHPENSDGEGPVLEESSAYYGLLHPREPDWEPELRIEQWKVAEGSLATTMRIGEETYPIEGASCKRRGFSADLAGIACDGFALIYGAEGPLVLSYPDYNRPLAEIAASFSYEGQRYHLVNLGLKAQDATGLLFHDGSSWQLRLRPRTTPNLC